MSDAAPVSTTQRLLACLEAFSHEEEGAAGHDNWADLVALLERESLLLQRLALEKPPADPDLKSRLQALSQRYEQLSQRMDAAKSRDIQELATLSETSHRMTAVRHTYLKR
jgi:hypothetical protein